MTFQGAIAAAAVFTLAGFAGAQTTSAGFDDVDGDGIGDRAAEQHRTQTRVMQTVAAKTQTKQQKKLTPAQKRTMKQLATRLKESGATSRQVEQAVQNRLRELGVKPEVPWSKTLRETSAGQRLTPEQKRELAELIKGMRADGETGADIKSKVDTKMGEWSSGGSGSETGGSGGSQSGGNQKEQSAT